MNIVFRPNTQGSLTVAATNVSTSIALPPGGGGMTRVVNTGPGNAYVEFGPSGCNAAVPTTSPGSTCVVANAPASFFRLRPSDANVAVVADTTASVKIARGDEV